jgi:hypothetical protein
MAMVLTKLQPPKALKVRSYLNLMITIIWMSGVSLLHINKFNGLYHFVAVAQHNPKKVPRENVELSPEI